MHLGAEAVQDNNDQQRLVIALAVPTRSYAAVLLAVGAIVSNAKTINAAGQVSPESHFEMLCGLPTETSVILREEGKPVKGIFVGTRDFKNDGNLRIGVQIQNSKGGALTTWLSRETSQKVQVSSMPWSRLPKDADNAREVDTSSSEFTSEIFQGIDLWNFVTESSLDCVILGNVGTLEKEATTTKLSIGSRGTEASAGSLQDILRICRLFRNNEAFRSQILSVNSNEHAKLSEGMLPRMVIFDGAVGFLKWRHYWSQSNWVVILDRTETRFLEAVQSVNEEFLSRIDERELNLSNPTPQSVELKAFTVTR